MATITLLKSHLHGGKRMRRPICLEARSQRTKSGDEGQPHILDDHWGEIAAFLPESMHGRLRSVSKGLRDNKLLCRAERTLSLPSEEQEEVQDCKSRSSDLLGVRTIAAILSAGKSNCKKRILSCRVPSSPGHDRLEVVGETQVTIKHSEAMQALFRLWQRGGAMRQITRLELDWEYLEKDLAEFLVLMGMEQGLQDLGSHRGPALIEMRGLEIAASVGSSVCRLFIDNMAEGYMPKLEELSLGDLGEEDLQSLCGALHNRHGSRPEPSDERLLWLSFPDLPCAVTGTLKTLVLHTRVGCAPDPLRDVLKVPALGKLCTLELRGEYEDAKRAVEHLADFLLCSGEDCALTKLVVHLTEDGEVINGQALVTALSGGAAPHLEELSLNSVILDEEEDPINSLTQAIECGVLHKLRRLSLDMCFYDYEYMQRMVAAVAELPYLEHLTLADTLDIRVGQGVAKALTMRTVEDTSEAIHPFRSLQSLELSAVMVADFDKMLKALADDKCPMGLPALTKLKVHFPDMVADLPSLNGAAWLRLPMLEELEICSDEGIFRHAVTALAGALVATRATSKLRVLVLGLIDEACAGILVDAIGTKGACPQLQTLELRDLKPEDADDDFGFRDGEDWEGQHALVNMVAHGGSFVGPSSAYMARQSCRAPVGKRARWQSKIGMLRPEFVPSSAVSTRTMRTLTDLRLPKKCRINTHGVTLLTQALRQPTAAQLEVLHLHVFGICNHTLLDFLDALAGPAGQSLRSLQLHLMVAQPAVVEAVLERLLTYLSERLPWSPGGSSCIWPALSDLVLTPLGSFDSHRLTEALRKRKELMVSLPPLPPPRARDWIMIVEEEG